jgi:hypothetical protein
MDDEELTSTSRQTRHPCIISTVGDPDSNCKVMVRIRGAQIMFIAQLLYYGAFKSGGLTMTVPAV